MGNGVMNTCCTKDDKDEIEFLSKRKNDKNYNYKRRFFIFYPK